MSVLINEAAELSELRRDGLAELDFWERAFNGLESPEAIVTHRAPNLLLQGAYDEDDYGMEDDD